MSVSAPLSNLFSIIKINVLIIQRSSARDGSVCGNAADGGSKPASDAEPYNLFKDIP